jgi:hypothetical protein
MHYIAPWITSSLTDASRRRGRASSTWVPAEGVYQEAHEMLRPLAPQGPDRPRNSAFAVHVANNQWRKQPETSHPTRYPKILRDILSLRAQKSKSYVVSTMPNRASPTHTHIRATCWYGGHMVTYDHRKVVLDFWLGILLTMATVLAIAVVLIMPYAF